MKKKVGDKVSNIRLTGLDGALFDLSSLKGRPYMLSFFRACLVPVPQFADAPTGEPVQRTGRSNHNRRDFRLPLDNLREHADRHHSPFPVLADEQGTYYAQYGIERSILGVLKGMFFRMPTMMRGMLKGYVPLKIRAA